MSKTKLESAHQELEQTLGHLLRVGVMISALVVFLGGALYLSRHGAAIPDYRVFHGEPAQMRTISGIVTDALSLHSRGAIQLGLLLLVATPVARVLVAFFAFARERDSLYSVMTLIVLALLLYNLSGSVP